MVFDPLLEIRLDPASLGFEYGPGVIGPPPEFRRMADIRPSLLDPSCEGPDPVYAIAMDVCRIVHRDELLRRKLLFGVVAFAGGKLGKELVRSQGHVHAVSSACGCSTPELIEVWQGRAIVYMQENTDEDPGRCFAVEAEPGDKVVIPPEWAHCVINADPGQTMFFGACCVRDYGFEYRAVRARGGLAWFPVWSEEEQQLRWERNPAYKASLLVNKQPRAFPQLNVRQETPIYEQFSTAPESLQWISVPSMATSVWQDFEP
jgi:glucose-6-phosphate isomerase